MFADPAQRQAVDLLDAAVAILGRCKGKIARELEAKADRLLDRTVGWMRDQPTAPDIAKVLAEAQTIHRQAQSLVEGARS